MLQLTQIYSTGPATEDRPIWVNPRHVMYAQPTGDDDDTTTITMADGWTFKCRESPHFVSNHL